MSRRLLSTFAIVFAFLIIYFASGFALLRYNPNLLLRDARSGYGFDYTPLGHFYSPVIYTFSIYLEVGRKALRTP